MTKNDKNVNVCKYMSECTDDLSLHGCCCYNVTGYLAAGCVVNVTGYLAAGCVVNVTSYLAAGCVVNVTGYLAAGCVVNVAGYLAAGCVAILHFTAAMVRRFLRA